jgi:hypothetical protein
VRDWDFYFFTGDSTESQRPPDPGKSVNLRVYDSASELNLRKSAFRTVDCIIRGKVLKSLVKLRFKRYVMASDGYFAVFGAGWWGGGQADWAMAVMSV